MQPPHWPSASPYAVPAIFYGEPFSVVRSTPFDMLSFLELSPQWYTRGQVCAVPGKCLEYESYEGEGCNKEVTQIVTQEL